MSASGGPDTRWVAKAAAAAVSTAARRVSSAAHPPAGKAKRRHTCSCSSDLANLPISSTSFPERRPRLLFQSISGNQLSV